MKITVNKETQKLSDLNIGDVFKFENDLEDIFYLKISPNWMYDPTRSKDIFLDLQSYQLLAIRQEDMPNEKVVIFKHAELILENK